MARPRPAARFLLLATCALLLAALTGCAAAPGPGGPPAPTLAPTRTALPSPALPAAATPPGLILKPTLALPAATAETPPAPAPTAAQRATPAADDWQSLPVLPALSPRALEIYRRGQVLGRDPRAFSKVGDCESAPDWFLADFDRGPKYYQLGPYAGLQPVIDYFAGSYRHISLAARPGFTATSVLTPLWADPKQCGKDESPLACEYRVSNPAFAIIMLGSNNAPRPERFEPQMRKILDQTIERGIVPVLVTKADNLEGNHAINQAIARLAAEYGIPLWNFWAAVQPLPHHGLQDDGAHLTWAANRFDDPAVLDSAWPVRNLTALQVLDILMRGTVGQ